MAEDRIIKLKAATIEEAQEKLSDLDISNCRDGDIAEITLPDDTKLIYRFDECPGQDKEDWNLLLIPYPPSMGLDIALKKLGISDYKARIFNSNSHGELLHLNDYIWLAEVLEDDTDWFRPWFEEVVRFAENNWKRPESIFQHIITILRDECEKK